MALASNKKVLVVRFDRETLQGFVQTPGGLEGDALELLRPEGNLVRVPFSETKLVCFVRDFEAGETWQRASRLRHAAQIRRIVGPFPLPRRGFGWRGSCPITCCNWRRRASAPFRPTPAFRTNASSCRARR